MFSLGSPGWLIWSVYGKVLGNWTALSTHRVSSILKGKVTFLAEMVKWNSHDSVSFVAFNVLVEPCSNTCVYCCSLMCPSLCKTTATSEAGESLHAGQKLRGNLQPGASVHAAGMTRLDFYIFCFLLPYKTFHHLLFRNCMLNWTLTCKIKHNWTLFMWFEVLNIMFIISDQCSINYFLSCIVSVHYLGY